MSRTLESPAQTMDSDVCTDAKAQRNRRKTENQKMRKAEEVELLALMNTVAV